MPDMVDAAAPEIATVLESAIHESIAGGKSLDGQAWAPTKDGRQPLQNAASAVTVSVMGRTILIQLTGYHVFHQFGTSRLPRRPIIPMGGLPDRLGNAIRKGLITMGTEWMTRKGSHKAFGKGAKPSTGAT